MCTHIHVGFICSPSSIIVFYVLSMSCAVTPAWTPPLCDSTVNSTQLPLLFLFSKSFTSKHWATLSFALLSSSMGKSYLMLSSWLVLQNMISFPPGSNVHHPSHLQLLCGRNEACGRRCISVFWVLSCISVFLLRRLDHNGISGRAAGSSRSGEIFGGIRGKQLQRLIYRQPPAFLQKSSRIWH